MPGCGAPPRRHRCLGVVREVKRHPIQSEGIKRFSLPAPLRPPCVHPGRTLPRKAGSLYRRRRPGVQDLSHPNHGIQLKRAVSSCPSGFAPTPEATPIVPASTPRSSLLIRRQTSPVNKLLEEGDEIGDGSLFLQDGSQIEFRRLGPTSCPVRSGMASDALRKRRDSDRS